MTRFVLSAALLVALAGCDQQQNQYLTDATEQQLVMLVEVKTGVPLEYSTVGTVVSDQQLDITSRLTGYIKKISVKEGDKVEQGQILVRLDSADIDGAIHQASAAASTAQAAFNDAQLDFEKFQNLLQRGSASDNEFRKIKLKRDAAKEMLNSTKAALSAAKAQLNYIDIKAPVSGYVIAKIKHEGDMALPGVPILAIQSRGGMLFQTYITEDFMASVAPGMQVQVRLDQNPQSHTGAVTHLVPAADPVTHSYLAKISLPNDAKLMSGMFGRATFRISTKNEPYIPENTLVERGGLKGVFVVDSDSIVRFHWLRLGRRWDDNIEVTAGLSGGEMIVSDTASRLRDGEKVTVTESVEKVLVTEAPK
ncbi:efflux RND transporter periplasmic adaptor subunit [Teredinibacter haidensis]|uniref:efflux RND transporter periplasmic adaptor subunit n=1 Tax=Teredinibacter haidensis TaxID=2731755 RepID=UPI000948D828|nr:efflux RND transporter periplasmic adaptor subunit [Teredinibacter haidensis]